MKIGNIIPQAKDENGKFIGTHDENCLMNTLAYDVEFPDGAVKRYVSHIITKTYDPNVESRAIDWIIYPGRFLLESLC